MLIQRISPLMNLLPIELANAPTTLQHLKLLIKQDKRIKELEEQIRIMPGGEAYFEAMEYYKTLRKQALEK